MTQAVTFHCEACGRLAPVTPTASPYLFDAVCLCGFAYRLAWTTRTTPPTFNPPAPVVGQLCLDWNV